MTRLSRGAYLGYSVGAAGTAGFGTVPGLLLAIYLTNTLGVAAAVAAFIVLIPKLWDVYFLPLVGRLSDRAAHRTGTRRPFLLVGALGMLLSFPLMFAVPAGVSPTVACLWVLVAFLIAASAFGFFQVPYIALAAEITDSPRERTTLMSWRVALQAAGILFFGVSAPLLRDAMPQANAGYLVMGLVIGFLMMLTMLVCWWSLRRTRRFVEQDTVEAGLLEQLRVSWQCRPFRLLLSAFVVQALGAGAILSAAAYFTQYILQLNDIALVFGALILPAIIVMPLWNWVGHRHGKRFGYLLSSFIFIGGSLLALLTPLLPTLVAIVLIMTIASGYAGMQMFPLAMLPDTIADEAAATGAQRAGTFTGVWTAGETAAFALGPALVLALLAITGFVSSTDNAAVQPGSAVTGVMIAFAVLPAALVALSLPLIWMWRSASEVAPAQASGT